MIARLRARFAGKFIDWLYERAEDLIQQRDPDVKINDRYLWRWYLIPRNPVANVYLHVYYGSDDDRALHDHPWVSASLMLRGCLVEHDLTGMRAVTAGQWRLRRAVYAHRLELPQWCPRAITLFLTGPRIREWGFLCPQGWRHWREFTDPTNPANVGRGCD